MTKPYRPSNGTEGEMFFCAWCDRCKHDAAFRRNPDSGRGCALIANSMAYNIGDPEYPKQWVEDDDGSNPRCTKFALPTPRKRRPSVDKRQTDLLTTQAEVTEGDIGR